MMKKIILPYSSMSYQLQLSSNLFKKMGESNGEYIVAQIFLNTYSDGSDVSLSKSGSLDESVKMIRQYSSWLNK